MRTAATWATMGPSAAAPVGKVIVVSVSVVTFSTVVTETAVVALVVTEVVTEAALEVVVVVWAMAMAAKMERRAAVTFISVSVRVWGVRVGGESKRRSRFVVGSLDRGGVPFYWAAELGGRKVNK